MKTKNILTGLALAAGLTGAAGAAIVAGDVIAINFGTTATGNNAFTTVDTADTATTAFSGHALNGGVLRNTLGANITGVDFSITNMTGDNAGEAASAAETQWISNDSGGTGRITDGDAVIDGSGDRAYATLTFTGLDNALTYDFSAVHSNNDNFSALWQEVGNVSNTQGPNLASISFTGLSTDGSGKISFYMIRRNNIDGSHVAVDNITLTAVPEPSTTALLGLGGLALILRRRK
ncbi:MAG: PEP-CTERM sorting domain-containing protein [Akkermansiaceae bacterium]|nr:PEP-CTERM sorting domain-containing protein [Akkermansiaceae bacterium]